MAGKVLFPVTFALDGFIAPESLADLMGQQWMFLLRFIGENLNLGEGGDASISGPFTYR